MKRVHLCFERRYSLISNLYNFSAECNDEFALNIAKSLDRCKTARSNGGIRTPACRKWWLCSRCNRNYQKSKRKKKVLCRIYDLICSGLVPVFIRLSVPECVSFTESRDKLNASFDGFMYLLKSRNACAKNDLWNKIVVGGKFGFHYCLNSEGVSWRNHVHILAWINVQNAGEIDNVGDSLRAHWSHCRGSKGYDVDACRFFDMKIIAKNENRPERIFEQVVRVMDYLIKLWPFVDAGKIIEAMKEQPQKYMTGVFGCMHGGSILKDVDDGYKLTRKMVNSFKYEGLVIPPKCRPMKRLSYKKGNILPAEIRKKFLPNKLRRSPEIPATGWKSWAEEDKWWQWCETLATEMSLADPE